MASARMSPIVDNADERSFRSGEGTALVSTNKEGRFIEVSAVEGWLVGTPCLPGVVIPAQPHHVVQRENRRSTAMVS